MTTIDEKSVDILEVSEVSSSEAYSFITDGSYEAKVDLILIATGKVIGGASALCGMDEKRWVKADRYARRSMAITRATGKAYRLAFAWIVAMAGYEPTNAEEMPFEPQKPPQSKTNHHGLTETELKDLLKLAEEKNAEIWTYDCYIRGHGNSTRARFYTGLYTWALDLKGNFYWCYTENFTWEGDRNSTHTLVLASDSGPVPSVQWEARREGVEDYRLLRLLESYIAAKPHHPKAIEASQWLDEIRGRVDWDLAGGMPKSVYPWDGPEIYPMCPNFKPEELPKIRTRVIDFILAISS